MTEMEPDVVRKRALRPFGRAMPARVGLLIAGIALFAAACGQSVSRRTPSPPSAPTGATSPGVIHGPPEVAARRSVPPPANSQRFRGTLDPFNVGSCGPSLPPPVLPAEAGFQSRGCYTGTLSGRPFSIWAFTHNGGFVQIVYDGRTELVATGPPVDRISRFVGGAACLLLDQAPSIVGMQLTSGAVFFGDITLPGVPDPVQVCGPVPGDQSAAAVVVTATSLAPLSFAAPDLCRRQARLMAETLAQAGQRFQLLHCQQTAAGKIPILLWTFRLGNRPGIGMDGVVPVIYLDLADPPARFQGIFGASACWEAANHSITSINLFTGALSSSRGERCP